MKVVKSISIDDEVYDKAKQVMNISAVVEDAIKKKLNIKEIEIKFACEFCFQEGPKETKETLNQNPRALTWLCPDEKWICNSCLTRKGNREIAQ